MFAKRKIHIDKKRIKRVISKIPYFTARHDFLIFLLLTVLVVGFTLLYLWHYIKIQEEKSQYTQTLTAKINEEEYNKFLETSRTRQENFWKAEQEEYKEVFVPAPKTLD